MIARVYWPGEGCEPRNAGEGTRTATVMITSLFQPDSRVSVPAVGTEITEGGEIRSCIHTFGAGVLQAPADEILGAYFRSGEAPYAWEGRGDELPIPT